MTPASKKLLALLAVLKHQFELGNDHSGIDFPSSELEKVAQLSHWGQVRRVLKKFEERGLLQILSAISGADAYDEDDYD